MSHEVFGSPEWRRLHYLLTAMGLRHREDKLDVIQEILGYRPQSTKNLTCDEIDDIIAALNQWMNLQSIRFTHGALFLEACALAQLDKRSSTDDVLSEYFASPDNNNYVKLLPPRERRALMARKVTPETTSSSYKDVLSIVESVKKGVKITDKSAQEIPSQDGHYRFGRLPKDECYKSAIPSLGVALETGGLPVNSVIHVWGEKGCGKTTWVLNEAAAQQRQGRTVVYINAESAYQPRYFHSLGVDLNEFIVVDVDSLESAGELIKDLAESGSLVIVDSIAALQSDRDLNRDYTSSDSRVGGSAGLWTSIINGFRTKAKDTTLILINQVRSDMKAGPYSDPLKPYGANAIQHAIDVSLRFRFSKNPDAAYLKELGMQKLSIRFDKNRWSDTKDKKVDINYKPGFPFSITYDLIQLAGDHIKFSKDARGFVTDTIIPDMKYEDGVLVKKANWVTFCCRDGEALDAIRADENWEDGDVPDMYKDDYVSIRFVSKSMEWLREHPTYQEWVEEKLLDTIDIDCENAYKNRDRFI